jgi:hypothetical protein
MKQRQVVYLERVGPVQEQQLGPYYPHISDTVHLVGEGSF